MATTMALSSSSFAAGEAVPRRHTCEGEDLSPALAWSGVPPAARALALIVDDPDAPDPAAPRTTWVHWVLYNLPASVAGLPEGVGAAALPAGTRVGTNDWHRAAYSGPCPPIGRHRYFFKLYALDVELPELGASTKGALEKAMRGHVLAEAQLMGTFEKNR
jgi:Raf kinase inhibitor-like YbhB/YbcL family protein